MKHRPFYLALVVVGIGSIFFMSSFGSVMVDRVRDVFIRAIYVGYEFRSDVLDEPIIRSDTIRDARLVAIEDENAALRSLLDFKERFQFEGVGADVLARSYDPTRAHLIVNRGQLSGVERGAPVVVGDGVVVGVIQHVMETSSVVQLLIDPASKVAGRILNSQQSEGVVAGGHGIVVRVELIPRDEEVPLGAAVVTSGLDQSVPRGLLIGHVTALEQDTSSLFNRAIVRTPIDYQKIKHVMIATAL